MAASARPIPVKLTTETLDALDALVAAGRQPTRSAAIRAGIELLLESEQRRALDLTAALPEPATPRPAPPAPAASAGPARPRRRSQTETFVRGAGAPAGSP